MPSKPRVVPPAFIAMVDFHLMDTTILYGQNLGQIGPPVRPVISAL